LDLHTGGVDLVFPHHEDEIAQSEAATGKTFSRHWCHGAFLLTDGTKMAKRVGNTFTLSELRDQGISAAAIRCFFFTSHYRKELNLSDEALEAAGEAVRRVGEFASRLESAEGGTNELASTADAALEEFRSALFDDLNAPEAQAALFKFIKAGNRELDRNGRDTNALERARQAFATMNEVLDIVPDRGNVTKDVSSWVEARIAARRAARERRDFAEADRIRAELAERGVALEDSGDGTKWKLVGPAHTS
jgi:cysteinyl-tRNA synthetase